MLWPRAKSSTSPRRRARAALSTRPTSARTSAAGQTDCAQVLAAFFCVFRRAALKLLCETPRKWRICAPAAPRSLDHVTSGCSRGVA